MAIDVLSRQEFLIKSFEFFRDSESFGLFLLRLPKVEVFILHHLLIVYLAEFVLSCRAAVHKRLRNHRETRIDDIRLVNVEDKLRVLDDVHPESQR